MKKRVFYLFAQVSFLFSIPLTLNAQGMVSVLDKQTNPGEVLVEFDNRTFEVEGNYYIQEEWAFGDIYLETGLVLKGQMIRYDLEYDLLEVRFNDQVKVVPIRQLKAFTTDPSEPDSRFFRNCNDFLFHDGTRLSGICEVIDSSYYGLLAKYEYQIKKADYVPELDMGSRHDKIKIQNEWLISIADTVYEIPKRKTAYFQIYEQREPGVRDFVKAHKLHLKDIDDLKLINGYLNRKKR